MDHGHVISLYVSPCPLLTHSLARFAFAHLVIDGNRYSQMSKYAKINSIRSERRIRRASLALSNSDLDLSSLAEGVRDFADADGNSAARQLKLDG